MVKHFCDLCGEHINFRNNSGRKLKAVRHVDAQASTNPKETQYAVSIDGLEDCCIDCLIRELQKSKQERQ